jgi:membrane protein YdbS with pleckstrin-like domain
MIKFIKIITAVVFISSVTSIVYGYFLKPDFYEKYIGFGVAGLFFIVFPLFSYYRWKDKNVKDYMLTKENLEQMRKNQKEKKY